MLWRIINVIYEVHFYVVRYAECFFYCRSLVALSLILALLLFKPAPLYILDEVDAALDLSHTQNIGQMLRTHFRHSQVMALGADIIILADLFIIFLYIFSYIKV